MGIGYFAYKNIPKLEVISSYSARMMCTCHFEGQRKVEFISKQDLSRSPLNLAKTKINSADRSVESTVFGLYRKQAIHVPGKGCVLIHGENNYSKNEIEVEKPKSKFDFPFSKQDHDELDESILKYFQTPNSDFSSILIIKNDSIISEHYKKGIDKKTVQLGWSMTKSWTNALAGRLIENGTLKLDQTNLFPEWEKDRRSEISLRNLLNMTSGISWDENYEEISDATEMLFLNENMIPDILDNQLEFQPDTHWEYSSGSTNLIMAFFRDKLDPQEYLHMPHLLLFNPLGMESAFIETDENGNFIGSSYGYASAHDWAKFGRLFLNKGKNPDGIQIVSEEWIKFSTTPANKNTLNHGAHWWLNVENKTFPDAPEDLFYASGFDGQFIYIIPSEELIIVRTGLGTNYNENEFLKEIIELAKT